MSFLSKLLGIFSGSGGIKLSDQLLFDKVVGFKGIVPGVGTSTIVQNVALALSETTNFDICVLDTNFFYPTQYPMLVGGVEEKRKDYLDFTGDLSEIAVETTLRNVFLVSMYNRNFVDMLSTRDSEVTVDRLMGSLKTRFDVVLVDLSYELSQINTYTAIKCNKIINVADQSLKCVYNMQKSLNMMASLAIPLAKANQIVLNKVLPDVVTNTKGVVQESGLTVLGEIPFSLEIAKCGASGKKIWAATTSNREIFTFSQAINSVVDSILQRTPLNAKYMDKDEVQKLKESQEVSKTKKKTKSKKSRDEIKETESVEPVATTSKDKEEPELSSIGVKKGTETPSERNSEKDQPTEDKKSSKETLEEDKSNAESTPLELEMEDEEKEQEQADMEEDDTLAFFEEVVEVKSNKS